MNLLYQTISKSMNISLTPYHHQINQVEGQSLKKNLDKGNAAKKMTCSKSGHRSGPQGRYPVEENSFKRITRSQSGRKRGPQTQDLDEDNAAKKIWHI